MLWYFVQPRDSYHHIAHVFSCYSCSPHLDHFTGESVVTTKYWPACTICLGECHLQLGTQDPELALFWLDTSEQWELGVVSLAVGCTEIKVDTIGLEVNNSMRLVDLLEIQRGSDSNSGLVKVVSAASLA